MFQGGLVLQGGPGFCNLAFFFHSLPTSYLWLFGWIFAPCLIGKEWNFQFTHEQCRKSICLAEGSPAGKWFFEAKEQVGVEETAYAGSMTQASAAPLACQAVQYAESQLQKVHADYKARALGTPGKAQATDRTVPRVQARPMGRRGGRTEGDSWFTWWFNQSTIDGKPIYFPKQDDTANSSTRQVVREAFCEPAPLARSQGFCQQHGKPIPELEVKISKKGRAPRTCCKPTPFVSHKKPWSNDLSGTFGPEVAKSSAQPMRGASEPDASIWVEPRPSCSYMVVVGKHFAFFAYCWSEIPT